MDEYNSEDGAREYSEHRAPLFYLFEGSVIEIEPPQIGNSQLVKLVEEE